MMRVRLTLKPGQLGTKGPLARYGNRLVCVRYRYDEQTHQRVKTVELIEKRTNWETGDRSQGDRSMIAVRVGRQELELRQKVKSAGGRWDHVRRVWVLSRERVKSLGLESRIVGGAI